MSLTLRPTVIAGERVGADFIVVDDDLMVGRIMLVLMPGGLPRWSWMINLNVPIPGDCRGVADALPQAKAAWCAAWDRFKPTLGAERLAELLRRQETVDRRFE